MKLNLFVFTGLLIGAACLSNLQAYGPQNEQDYRKLLSRSHTYIDTKVRNLKYLSAKLIVTLCQDIKKDNISKAVGGQKLPQPVLDGINNLEKFATKIMARMGQEQPIVHSAFDYVDAVVLFGAEINDPHYEYQSYFYQFNKYYMPLIQAIMTDYGDITRLPLSIDWQTIERWAEPQYKDVNEP